MNSSTLTSKGQVTIPVELREALGLHAGDTLVFEPYDGKILVFKRKNNIAQSFGIYKVNKKITDASIKKAIHKGYSDDSD